MHLKITNLTPFEKLNLVLATATFSENITPEIQAILNDRVRRFNQAIPGGSLKPRCFLEYRGNQILFRQSSITEAPTKEHFNRLLQALELTFTDETITAMAPLPQKKSLSTSTTRQTRK